jgi:hypothetical protein
MNSGFGKHRSWCVLWLGLALWLLVAVPAMGQQAAATKPSSFAKDETPATPSAQPAEPVKAAESVRSERDHRFWDKKNAWLFAGVGAFRALDYASTLNMQARGREEILLPDDVVNNRAGFAALEAAGAATSIGLSYIMHRTGHHKLERWVSVVHIGVASVGSARNYALKTYR